jgi:hypothetical protein
MFLNLKESYKILDVFFPEYHCEVLKMGRMYKLSIKCLLDLFDKMIKPILLYGCEVWGFSNNDILEKIHLNFCKILLKYPTKLHFMIFIQLTT